MSTLNEIFAQPHSFVHKGRTYQVRHVTNEVETQYELRMFERAKQAAKTLRDAMSADEYRQHLKALNDDYIAGKYSMLSESGRQALETDHGKVLLLCLLLDLEQMDAVRLVAEQPPELAATLELVLHESFPTLEAETSEKK